MEFANIEVSVKTNPLGKREAVNFKWIGESPYVRVSLDFVDECQKIDGEKVIQIGPYKLLLFEDTGFYYHTYVRADKFGAFRVGLYKATRLVDLVYRRLIITLAVWRLAEYHEASIPTWRDIKILKRFPKWN